MSQYTTTMIGGITMTAISGILMIWWLTLGDVSSGFVGLLFILGMFVGLAVLLAAQLKRCAHPTSNVGDTPWVRTIQASGAVQELPFIWVPLEGSSGMGVQD